MRMVDTEDRRRQRSKLKETKPVGSDVKKRSKLPTPKSRKLLSKGK